MRSELRATHVQKGLTMRLSALALCFAACLALAVSGCAHSSKTGEVDAASECATECSSAKTECSSAAKAECAEMKKECSAAKTECSATPE